MEQTNVVRAAADGPIPYKTWNLSTMNMRCVKILYIGHVLTLTKEKLEDQEEESGLDKPAGGDAIPDITNQVEEMKIEEDAEEIDELQDDSSLLDESDEEEDSRAGKKRRRKPSPPLKRKPARISSRKRPRRETAETTKVNGHATGAEIPLARLKGSKGQNTKFWYYEEGDSAPSKRPEMLDDPEKMIKRGRKSEKIEKREKSYDDDT
jgi:hypothetical protein